MDFKRPISVNGVPVSLDGHTHSVMGATEYWDRVYVPLATARIAATNKPSFNATENGYNFPNNDTTHILYFTVVMPPNWKVGSTIYPVVHAHQARNNNPGFVMAYRWISPGEAVSNWSTLLLDTWIEPYHGVTIHNIVRSEAGLVPYYGDKASSELQVKLYRTNSAYNTSIVTTAFGIAYECDSFGFSSAYTK